MKVEILEQKGNKFLWIDDALWMWDIPTEQKIQKRIADESYGEVLVAGYGLGLVQKFLLQNTKVTSVTTIEKNIDVTKACHKVYKEIYGYIKYLDFYDYNTTFKFDCIIGDIWQEIVPESLEDYKRFETQALKLVKPDGKIFAWGKEYFEYLIEKGS